MTIGGIGALTSSIATREPEEASLDVIALG